MYILNNKIKQYRTVYLTKAVARLSVTDPPSHRRPPMLPLGGELAPPTGQIFN